MLLKWGNGKVSASVILRQADIAWVDPNDARRRLDERHARMAAEARTPAQRWLGDLPADRCSALSAPPKADIVTQSRNVRFVPEAVIAHSGVTSTAPFVLRPAAATRKSLHA